MIRVHGVPFYWGVERDAVDRSFLTKATLDEVLPPYRFSKRAIRVRVSHRHWLHMGLCRYKTEVTPWGYEMLPEYIGGWRYAPEDDSTESVPHGPAAGGGFAPGAGDIADADGGTDAWPEPPGDRQDLAAGADGSGDRRRSPSGTGVTEAR